MPWRLVKEERRRQQQQAAEQLQEEREAADRECDIKQTVEDFLDDPRG
jgi:ubiquinone biosynthesis protein UbiJ